MAKPKTQQSDVCGLVLSLNNKTEYQVHPLGLADLGPEDIKGFRLTKLDGKGTVYLVIQSHDGLTCTCQDFQRRHAGLGDRGCKHIRSLVATTLLQRDNTSYSKHVFPE